MKTPSPQTLVFIGFLGGILLETIFKYRAVFAAKNGPRKFFCQNSASSSLSFITEPAPMGGEGDKLECFTEGVLP
ncbi:MAG: hypothetical protein IKE64_12140 [Thermoguttaceae bacterium]|nr:hypothetical protein [Thermoguttaceae bacterium]